MAGYVLLCACIYTAVYQMYDAVGYYKSHFNINTLINAEEISVLEYFSVCR